MHAQTRTLILLFSLASLWFIGLPPSTAAPATPIVPTAVPATPILPNSASATPILPTSAPETSVPATPTLPTSAPETPILPTSVPVTPTLPTSAPETPIFPTAPPTTPTLPAATPASPTIVSTLTCRTTFTQGNDDDWPEEDDELPVSSWPAEVPWPDNWTPRAEDCVNAPNPRNASTNNLGRCRRPNLQALTAFAAWTVVIAVVLAFLIEHDLAAAACLHPITGDHMPKF